MMKCRTACVKTSREALDIQNGFLYAPLKYIFRNTYRYKEALTRSQVVLLCYNFPFSKKKRKENPKEKRIESPLCSLINFYGLIYNIIIKCLLPEGQAGYIQGYIIYEMF